MEKRLSIYTELTLSLTRGAGRRGDLLLRIGNDIRVFEYELIAFSIACMLYARRRREIALSNSKLNRWPGSAHCRTRVARCSSAAVSDLGARTLIR